MFDFNEALDTAQLAGRDIQRLGLERKTSESFTTTEILDAFPGSAAEITEAFHLGYDQAARGDDERFPSEIAGV